MKITLEQLRAGITVVGLNNQVLCDVILGERYIWTPQNGMSEENVALQDKCRIICDLTDFFEAHGDASWRIADLQLIRAYSNIKLYCQGKELIV